MQTRIGAAILALLLIASLGTLWSIQAARTEFARHIAEVFTVPEEQQSALCITTSWYTRAIDGSCSFVEQTDCRKEGETLPQLKARHQAEVALGKAEFPVAEDCPED